MIASAMHRLQIFFAFLVLTLPTNVNAQSSSVTFEHFTPDQGMSGAAVTCIFQDRIGYLWFGAFSGLDRYDGYSFTSYKHNPDDPSSQPNGLVYALCEDKAGNLWIGTSRGLDRLDRATETFAHFIPHPPGPETELSNHISAIQEDRYGDLWVGTQEGLNKFDPTTGTFTYFRHDSMDAGSLSDDLIGDIHEDKAGSLWIGTGSGLDKLDRETGKFIHYLQDQYRIETIFEDLSGILWLGTGGGLLEFDQTAGTISHYVHDPGNPQSLSSNYVTSICEGEANELWVGTLRGGLNAFDRKSKRFARYGHDEKDPGSLSSDGVYSVYRERSGTVWVTTPNAGVNKLNRPKRLFAKYVYEDQKPFSILCDVFEGNDGKIWIGTSKRWEKFDPATESFIRYPLAKGLYPFAEDKAGNLWIGKRSGGFYKRNRNGKVTSVHDSSGGEFHQTVNCFCRGRDGAFWIGTVEGGIFAVDPGTLTFTLAQQTKVQINAIHEDALGLIWAGTWEGGLLCYDRKKQTAVRFTSDPRNPSSPSGNNTMSICEDKSGTLWFGTGGLNRYDRTTGTFTHFSQKDGLPTNAIFMILEDGVGNLWLSTNKGISRFDPRNKRFKNYDVSYGLAGSIFRPQSGCRTSNGEMYFGGIKGLTRFHPDSIRDNPFVPPIVLTTFRKFEKPFPLEKEIRLPYTDNFISFEFAALSYVSPERNQYAYKMEGLDNDWVYSGTRRYAGYPHLEPGDYVFRVKGSNNDGVWNEGGTSIAVIIMPPFWATWWFRGFVFIAMLVSVGGSIRYIEMRKLKRRIERLESERAIERERVRISQDMHDEVGAGLTEIGILSELAKRVIQNPKEAEIHMQRVSQTSRETIASIGEIIWAINPKNDLLHDLVAYMRQYAARYLGSTPIKLQFDIPETIPEFHLSAEARRNIFLVVKETLHNIVKHSEATEVLIKVSFTQECVEIRVKDNGKGFSVGDLSGFGNGLRNMEKRMSGIGGTCEIKSERGEGTSVMIRAGL
jgi:ligand-binding sensor domain-containing protein/signal transduction histidine kinase